MAVGLGDLYLANGAYDAARQRYSDIDAMAATDHSALLARRVYLALRTDDAAAAVETRRSLVEYDDGRRRDTRGDGATAGAIEEDARASDDDADRLAKTRKRESG